MSAIKKGIVSALRYFGYDIVRYKNIENSISRLKKDDIFSDSSGNRYERLVGYRDLVVPSWREMFLPQSVTSTEKLDVGIALKQVAELSKLLQIFGYGIAGKDVLEVGCHDGRNAFAIAKSGANHVDAIDIPVYGVLQKEDGEPDVRSLERQSQYLHQVRMLCAKAFDDDSLVSKVSFSDLDVTDLNKKNAYDLIVSWETLEHITNPRKAIANMFKALRPNGMCFHEYNSYYSLNGGHSLCTLDFPYGHARLSATDFERYIQKYRPQEVGVATNFYNHCLNRMTISDLKEACSDTGFDVLALCTWQDGSNLAIIDQIIMEQCKRLKANVSIEDLISPRIWILMQKPNNSP
jgi:2-polyprenyl-3-methyl-5-hydroxy-6-metoxy-1,4-benzoquinol methylase